MASAELELPEGVKSTGHSPSSKLVVGTITTVGRSPLPRLQLPPESWDSHMHIFDQELQEYGANTPYSPVPSSLADAASFETSVGFRNMVFVQPSTYGFNNACILDALTKLGSQHNRGVVAFDPETTSLSTLRKWHKLGVRGVRVNLKSTDTHMDPASLERLLKRYATLLVPLGWILQLYVPMEVIPPLSKFLLGLNVKICFDHFASPTLSPLEQDPYTVPGFRSLVSLLGTGKVFVKLSAPYRVSSDPRFRDLEPMTRELIRIAGRRNLVFATDWPHTRYEGFNVRHFINTLIQWCGGDQDLIHRIFKCNAEELWDI